MVLDIPTVLTNEEFAKMMQEFDSAEQWMAKRLAANRAIPCASAPKQPNADSVQSAADNREAIDDSRS